MEVSFLHIEQIMSVKTSIFRDHRTECLIYLYTVLILGIIAFGFAVFQNPYFWQRNDVLLLSLFIILNIFAEGTFAILPNGGRMTASFSIILASLILFNPPVAVILAGVGNIFSTMFVQKRHWSIAAFNMAQYSIAYISAHYVMLLTFIWSSSIYPNINETLQLFFMAGAATFTYLIISVGTVNGYLNIRKYRSFFKAIKNAIVWKDDQWEFWQALALYPVAVLVARLYQFHNNMLGVFALIIPTILLIKLKGQQLQIERYKERLEQLYEMTKELGELSLHSDEKLKHKHIWQLVFKNISKIIDNSRCSIYRLEMSGLEQRIALDSSDMLYVSPENKYYVGDEGLLQQILLTGKGKIVSQFTPPTPAYTNWSDYSSILAEPMQITEGTDFIIVLFDVHPSAFQKEHQQLLQMLVKQIELTLKNIHLRQEIEEQAIKDGLMGIFNHRYLKLKMEEELSRAKRYKKPLSLIISDVDYFKKFNDTHGHLLGDHVLKNMALILQDSVRDIDIVARYGGEELAILLPETGLEAACEVAERVRKNVASFPFTGKDNQTVSLSTSIGVTCSDDDPNLTIEDLIIRSDTALYKAKNQGRNQICRAIVDSGKLIIETYSKGESPKIPDKDESRTEELDQETIVKWQKFILNGHDKIVDKILSETNSSNNEIISRQKTGEEAFFTLSLTALELLNEYIEDNTSDFWHTIHKDSSQTKIDFIQNTIKGYLTDRKDLLRFEDGLMQMQNKTLQLALKAPFKEQEKDNFFIIIQEFFKGMNLVAMDTTWNYYEAQQHSLKKLYDTSSTINEITQIDTLFQMITKLLYKNLKLDLAWISKATSNLYYHIQSVHGLSTIEEIEKIKTNIRINSNKPFFKHIIHMQNVTQTHDLSQQIPEHPVTQEFNHFKTVIFFPIVYQSKTIGLFAGFRKDKKEFDPDEIKLVKAILEEFAKGLNRLQQGKETQDKLLITLKTIVDLLEERQLGRSRHSERVSQLSGRIAQLLKLSLEEQQRLKNAAYLHDIGKISIPHHILEKTEPLLETDYHTLHQHVSVGARLIESIPSLQNLVPAIRHHHEHWDGTGYPDGLKEKQIPLFARIIGISNYYVNQTNKHPDLSSKNIVQSMKQCQHFDPKLCELLEQIVAYDRVPS